MKYGITFFILVIISNISSTYAGGLNDFMRGFSESTSQTFQQREEERQQQAIYQADFDAVRAQLQAEHAQREEQHQLRGSQAAENFKRNLATCSAKWTPNTVKKTVGCLNQAYITQYNEEGNTNVSLVNQFTSKNNEIAAQYANRKITQAQFQERLTQNVTAWHRAESDRAKERINNEYQTMDNIADKQAAVMFINQQQVRAQQQELERLRQGVADAQEAADEAKNRANASGSELNQLKLKVCGNTNGC